jgi:hypothetical protein
MQKVKKSKFSCLFSFKLCTKFILNLKHLNKILIFLTVISLVYEKYFIFRQQNKTEEIANTISHGLGLLFFSYSYSFALDKKNFLCILQKEYWRLLYLVLA